MLRRLTLAIALITGSVRAEDFEAQEFTNPEDVDAIGCGALEDGADLHVGPDGSLSGPVPWSVVRLVLPDLLGSASDPAWLAMPTSARTARPSTLGALGGRVLVDHEGAAIGVVRRVLVSMTEGRVLALDVDSAREIDGSTCSFVVPWADVDARGGELRARVDADAVRAAGHRPSV